MDFNGDFMGFPACIMMIHGIQEKGGTSYPLANVYIANWKIPMSVRKTRYQWTMFNGYFSHYQRLVSNFCVVCKAKDSIDIVGDIDHKP